MALVVKDRVKETTATTGTGTLTLAGADTGFQAFSSALSDGDTTYYSLVELSTGEWEVGLGTFTATGTTLARTTILASSNSGSAINLTAGEASVFITQPAGKAAFFDSNGDLILNQDPTTALMAATKEYVDTIAAAGIHYHDPVRVESPDTAGNLTATYDNGSSGVGATLTNAGTQAALVIDGVTVNTNDRVLIYSQTNGYENGIYTVTNTGSASTNWVLTRATDADSYGPSDPDSLGQGDAFFVKEGDTGAGELYVMNTAGEIIFGTTDIMFTVVAETAVYSAGDGLSLTGTTFAVGAGTGVTVSSSTVSIGQAVGTSDSPTFSSLSVTNAIDAASLSVENVAPSIYLLESDTTDLNTRFRTNGGQLNIQTSNDANTSNVSRFSIDHSTGDISFYEDTGTTAKFFWDASAERLGIGNAAPTNTLDVTGSFNVVDGNNTIDSSDANSYPRITTTNSNAQLGLFRSGTSAGGGYLGANADASLLVLDSSFTERVRVDSSGNFMVGGTVAGNAGTVSLNVGNVGVTNGGLQLWGTTTGTHYIQFGDESGTAANHYRGYMAYAHNDDSLRFGTASTERFRVDASGNLLVGATSFNNDLAGIGLGASNFFYATRSGNLVGSFNRLSTDGSIIDFRKDGTTVGSIGTAFGYMHLGEGVTGLGFRGADNTIYPYSVTGAVARDAAIKLGSSSYRFSDLYLSGAAYTHSIAKQTTDPIVINSTLSSSKALRVYYDMDIYNTINFTDSSWNVQGRIAGSSGNLNLTPATGGSVQITSTNDAMLKLIGSDTWAGISFDDSGAVTDYIWYNGTYGTFAIGGGGSSVSGKKLHVDGGMTIGSNYDATSSGTNSLKVEGEIYGNSWLRNINNNTGLYNEANAMYWYSTSNYQWNARSDSNYLQIYLSTSGNTTRGSLYADSSNNVGILDAGGNWAIQHANDAGTYFYTDNNTEEFRVGRDLVTGGYGTVQTSTTKNGWGGYSIGGQFVFMANGTDCGIYNDIDEDWMFYAVRNGSSNLYYNGSNKLATNSGGVTVTGTCTATSFSGDGSSLTNLPAATGISSSSDVTVESTGGVTYVKGSGGLQLQNSGANSALTLIPGYSTGTSSADYAIDINMNVVSLTGGQPTMMMTARTSNSVYFKVRSSYNGYQEWYTKEYDTVADMGNYTFGIVKESIRDAIGGSHVLLSYKSAYSDYRYVPFRMASDINLKTDIKKIENPLGKLEKINGYNFTWISSDQKDAGVIAQEIEEIMPDIVNTAPETDDAPSSKTVNYNGLVGLLIEAVKEQQKQIDELKEKLGV